MGLPHLSCKEPCLHYARNTWRGKANAPGLALLVKSIGLVASISFSNIRTAGWHPALLLTGCQWGNGTCSAFVTMTAAFAFRMMRTVGVVDWRSGSDWQDGTERSSRKPSHRRP